MRAGIVAGCVGLAMLLSGFDPNDRSYFRSGIGTELYTVDAASATELQNIYLDYLCRQSGSFVGAEVPSCAQQVIPANVWPVIVQAGMNDIDARCDSYLAWLDQRRRQNRGILAEIGAVRIAVDALTNPNIAGVSGVGLAAISAAFGLATNTVNNFDSLLLQVDQTTVQNVVVNNRRVFREDILKLSSSINNKPAAVHTLRTYLNICMPMTISAKINSTVTVFQETGTAAGSGPIIPTIGVPFKPQAPFQPRPVPPRQPDIVLGAEDIISGYPANVRTYTPEVIGSILTGLCAPATEHTRIGPVTRALLDIWEQTDTANATINGKIDSKRERQALAGFPECPKGILNAFERQTFSNPDGSMKSTKVLTELLDRAPPAANGAGLLGAPVPLSSTRTRIAQLRRDCFAGIKPLPSTMAEQVTPDFMEALVRYAKKRAEAPTPAAGQPAILPPC